MRKEWIQTLGCKALFPLKLAPDQVGTIEEIAHSLAGNFRFTRQTEARYSVAEHCVRGARLLPPAIAGAFLLHELSEVYLPDINSPTKPAVWVEVSEEFQLPEGATVYVTGVEQKRLVRWSVLERQHTRTILAALGLSSLEALIYSPEVKAMDMAMLAAEKRDLFSGQPEDWPQLEGVEPAKCAITAWSCKVAASEFLRCFDDLFRTPAGAKALHHVALAASEATAAY